MATLLFEECQRKLICQDQLMTLTDGYCMNSSEFQGLSKKHLFFPLSDLFCEMASKEESSNRSVFINAHFNERNCSSSLALCQLIIVSISVRKHSSRSLFIVSMIDIEIVSMEMMKGIHSRQQSDPIDIDVKQFHFPFNSSVINKIRKWNRRMSRWNR